MHRVYAGIAAATVATMLGTVPAVGGYSNTTKVSAQPVAQGSGDFTTVGIVTQVEGSGGAFAVEAEKSAAHAVEVGHGVQAGDQMWVEHKSLVRLTDTQGGRITIAGPASVEFVKSTRLHTTIKIFKGSVKFRASEGQTMHFENAFAAGSVAGEGAVWASTDTLQVLGLTGDVKAWHPHLAQAAVLVSPGFFTESSVRFKHLQPKRAVRVDSLRFEEFLSRFEESHAPIPIIEKEQAPGRAIASEKKQHVRGTRTNEDIVEAKAPDSMQYLRAHMAGKDFESEMDEVPLAAPGPRFDAYGQKLKSRGPAGERSPRFEVVKQTQKPDEEQKTLLRKLTGKRKVH